MTKHNENANDSPLAVYQVWEEMWTTLQEKQQGTDLRLSDDLQEFIEQTKQLVTLAEQESLDPSRLVSFLTGTERFYSGAGTSLPKLTSPLRTLLRHLGLRLEQDRRHHLRAVRQATTRPGRAGPPSGKWEPDLPLPSGAVGNGW